MTTINMNTLVPTCKDSGMHANAKPKFKPGAFSVQFKPVYPTDSVEVEIGPRIILVSDIAEKFMDFPDIQKPEIVDSRQNADISSSVSLCVASSASKFSECEDLRDIINDDIVVPSCVGAVVIPSSMDYYGINSHVTITNRRTTCLAHLINAMELSKHESVSGSLLKDIYSMESKTFGYREVLVPAPLLEQKVYEQFISSHPEMMYDTEQYVVRTMFDFVECYEKNKDILFKDMKDADCLTYANKLTSILCDLSNISANRELILYMEKRLHKQASVALPFLCVDSIKIIAKRDLKKLFPRGRFSLRALNLSPLKKFYSNRHYSRNCVVFESSIDDLEEDFVEKLIFERIRYKLWKKGIYDEI